MEVCQEVHMDHVYHGRNGLADELEKIWQQHDENNRIGGCWPNPIINSSDDGKREYFSQCLMNHYNRWCSNVNPCGWENYRIYYHKVNLWKDFMKIFFGDSLIGSINCSNKGTCGMDLIRVKNLTREDCKNTFTKPHSNYYWR